MYISCEIWVGNHVELDARMVHMTPWMGQDGYTQRVRVQDCYHTRHCYCCCVQPSVKESGILSSCYLKAKWFEWRGRSFGFKWAEQLKLYRNLWPRGIRGGLLRILSSRDVFKYMLSFIRKEGFHLLIKNFLESSRFYTYFLVNFFLTKKGVYSSYESC